MSRRSQRFVATLGMFLFAGWMIYAGRHGLVFVRSQLPVDYAGYIVAAFGLLGLCGVNIWRGGPLDPQNDQVAAV